MQDARIALGPAEIIASGPAEIIASGIVTSFQNNPVEVTFRTIKIIFELKDDKEKKGPYFTSKASLADKTVRITLFNFTEPLGVGTLTPARLGLIIGDRRVYFHVRVTSIGSSVDRTLHYTIYQAEQVEEAEKVKEAEQAKQDG